MTAGVNKDADHRAVAEVAADGVRCETCGERVYQLGSHWTHNDPGPPNHEASAGLPDFFPISHPSGLCAWCDAKRWRLVACPMDEAQRGAAVARLTNDALLPFTFGIPGMRRGYGDPHAHDPA